MPIVAVTVSEVRALRDETDGAGPGLLLPIPPVLSRVFHNPAALLSPAFGGDPGPAMAELDRAFQTHPDAFFAFTRGALAAEAGRLAEAEQAFLAAADATSLVPVQSGALYGAVYCQWELADRNPAARPELLSRAVQTARRLISRGRLNPGQAALVASVTIEADELDLARWVIRDWEREAPEDQMAWRKRLIVEFRAGAYGPAVAAADKILKRLPDDAFTRDYRAAAVQKQAEQGKTPPH